MYKTREALKCYALFYEVTYLMSKKVTHKVPTQIQ
jgi:hypothetical protein